MYIHGGGIYELYTYVNFAEDEAKKPKKKSFLRKHWKKLALGAGLIGATALTGAAMLHHDKKAELGRREELIIPLQRRIEDCKIEIARIKRKSKLAYFDQDQIRKLEAEILRCQRQIEDIRRTGFSR